MNNIYLTRLPNGMTCEAFANAEIALKNGDYVILKRDFSLEYVEIIHSSATDAPAEITNQLPEIQRIATVLDRATATENEAHAKSAYRTACSMVEKMQLPMKLLNASYSFDRKLVTIQFTADGRVDFRELVKELSHALGCRLDLRQIGVRDETSICGGIAVCGQVLCCSRFLREFNSINVKMAKDQDLSLTPSTISGVCGRLKCCLKFEHEGYVEMEKSMPRRGELCECEKGKGRVADRNMLTQMVTLSLEDGGMVTLHASELKYRLRGKAPEPKKVVKEEAPVEEFSYFPPVDIAPAAPAAPATEKKESSGAENENKNNKRRNNNRRNNKRRNNNHHHRNDNSGQRSGGSED
ncbi:MAG: stage 0 sporulation protein [Lentisphaeria bacterium]|nr:stage 0 sporulation protein [Lentisphaeria bacterium]